MYLNGVLSYKKNHLKRYTKDISKLKFKKHDVLVFDIEACAIKNHTEMLTYSIACISCYDETDTMYWTNSVDNFLDTLLLSKAKTIKIYAHNCLYDVKPFLLKYVEKYGNNELKVNTYTKKEFNKYINKNVEVTYRQYKQDKLKPFQYKLSIKDGIFYGLTIQTDTTKIEFLDSYKIIPQNLQSACSSFLDLKLPKDGLDYNKERTLEEDLTKEEMNYIYDDVFGLKYLIKLCCIDGFDVNGKHVRFTKLTNSSQSMYDYKQTLLEDYENRTNAFNNDEFYDYVENRLIGTNFNSTKNFDERLQILFESVYPVQTCFMDNWERLSYYGGLCTPHYENCKKYSNSKDHRGKVYDVNSLYPSRMEVELLPYGVGHYYEIPYIKMNEKYKRDFPLYIQDITIHDIEVKEDKMYFLQVKDNEYFNGRELIKNNINKYGNKVDIHLRLCNPLLELLFDCYNVKSYTLGSHIGFRGSYKLFDNYLKFWKEVKQTSKGAKRAVAKLRQNGLYGKFGMSGDNEITTFENVDGKFTINHTGETYVSNAIYLPMASFITSYAKCYLVNAINQNYDNFLYCDTDSIHLYGTEQAKGIEVDSKKYGAWDNEMDFDDFKYLSPKRYAERDINTKEWTIKCCGLTDKIMKKVNDINMFDICEYDGKTMNKMIKENRVYKKDSEDDVYYYKDKECTQRIRGLFKSKKSKIIKYGTDIQEQPYMISNNNYF